MGHLDSLYELALIEAARVTLSYTQLTAPIDGVTGIRQIDIGNIIHPTDPNGLVDVTQVQPISVIFTLPEETFPEIQDQMAKGTLAVYAYSQDDKTKLDEGKRILITYEQGFGDTIQFARFLEPVSHRGGEILLAVPLGMALGLQGAMVV